MKFGNVTQESIGDVSFELPPDHAENIKHLTGKADGKIYVGCGKWGRKEWVGHIFPEGTKEKDYLDTYVKHFNSIELNSTFYNAKRDNILSWSDKADDDFKYCPKFPRRISHIKRLNDVDDFVEYFVEACSNFKDSLGASFLQLPENYAPKYFDRLKDFLGKIPQDFSLALEVRHPEWFEEPVFSELSTFLEGIGKSLVITDTGGRRDAVHMRLTNSIAFVRFNGYLGHATDYERLDAWAERSVKWIDSGVKELYFFMHQEDEKFTPKTAAYYIDKVTALGGNVSKHPQFVD